MASLLLAIIYLAFISLGLPDSLLGSAWPSIQLELGVPLSYAGVITLIVSGSTIASSLISHIITKKIGTKWTVTISVLITAVSLYLFSISSSHTMICLVAVPYGLGAGSIDASLNNYVANNYSSKHMNWLHAFWGVGASISPFIMSHAIGIGSWQQGYQTVSLIQLAITALLFISLPLWNKTKNTQEEQVTSDGTMRQAFQIKGIASILIMFMCYCAIESTAGIWATSYFNICHKLTESAAAKYGSLYYIGIMCGRIISGFISEKLGDKRLLISGMVIMAVAIVMIALPFSQLLSIMGLVLLGLGSAPIYPAIIHSTPQNFGAANSQAVIGLQMAFAYTGSTLAPPIFGLIGEKISMWMYAPFMFVLLIIMIISNYSLNKALKLQDTTN